MLKRIGFKDLVKLFSSLRASDRQRHSIGINVSTKYEYPRTHRILSHRNHVVCKYSLKYSFNYNKDLRLCKGRNVRSSCVYVVKVSENQVVQV